MFCWLSTAIFPSEAIQCLGCGRDEYAELVARGELAFSFDAGYYLGRNNLKLHNFFDILIACLSKKLETSKEAVGSCMRVRYFLNEAIFCYDYDDCDDMSNWMLFINRILAEFGIPHLRFEIETLVARTHKVLSSPLYSCH